jgi:hypothetical protein
MSESLMSCPHCEAELTIDDAHLGQQMTCPTCSKLFVAGEADEEHEEVVEEVQSAPQVKKTSALAVTSLVMSLVCGGLALPAIICGHIARSKIKRSGGMLTGGGMALAGLIIGYIGIISSVGILLGVGLPAIAGARGAARYAQCSNNILVIQNAKSQWAMTNNKVDGDQIDVGGINRSLPNQSTPTCGGGGSYTYGKIGTAPVCSVHAGGVSPLFDMQPTQ